MKPSHSLRIPRLLSSLAALTLGLGALALRPAPAEPPATCYLLSYSLNNGEDGLHLAWSRDGCQWEALNGGKSYLAPEAGESKLMRDPCLIQGPDGKFHLIWTTTIPGKFPENARTADNGYNHRIYATTTKDFQTFTPTRLLYEPGFNVIDATLLSADGRWRLIVKDETAAPPKKNLRCGVRCATSFSVQRAVCVTSQAA